MHTEKLPKKLILSHRDEIERIFQKGKKASGRFVYFLFLPLPDDSAAPCRIGFICGKKTGHAVKRNYYKRIFREVFRKNKSFFTGFETLIISQSSITGSDFESLQEDIIKTAKKMK